jgi:hypothetical protein
LVLESKDVEQGKKFLMELLPDEEKKHFDEDIQIAAMQSG